ncbi:hypothetical protein [Streptococcus pyogenes]|uniref:hypothetical protein n=1 Tax=Streptococcus pyogenes TaxID=1314 RepID=UPI0010A18CD3|nr:hypothetical protein [Streptococcus pyogenes]VGQ38255.1 hypothetical membrane associated protein [Streptococcus pyogenes]VGQ71897.1 hypothetical membrane associated protein [Streptococcus pyogenes]VGU80450.1 Uncharacterised protein [Streptococcus pyogenes]VHA96836.1 Uncharacterised protein [Streptococcus pyogenes]VHB44361.1 Uncharacterised protein [Streptococcus pyogenes]
MRTKSKRFLKLAPLCLALLGTTLLMGQPVKAEAIPQSVVQTEGNVTQEGSSEDQVLNELSGFDGTEAQKQGYKAGYNDAIEGRPQTPRDQLEIPKNLDRSDEVDYKDGYGNGYNYGWEKNHPIEVAVMNFFNWVLSFFNF